jgi:excisionase family DNA binding protein
MNHEEFVSVEQMAACLGVNRKTIYDAVNAGELPGAQKLRGKIRIHKPTVLAWFASGHVAQKQQKASK